MKFYDTHFEDFFKSVEIFNFHTPYQNFSISETADDEVGKGDWCPPFNPWGYGGVAPARRRRNIAELRSGEDNINTFGNTLGEHKPHLIFYGPPHIGKFAQSLFFILSDSFSKSQFKFFLSHEQEHFFFKFSDYHFEIDFNANFSKSFWHELLLRIFDKRDGHQTNTHI